MMPAPVLRSTTACQRRSIRNDVELARSRLSLRAFAIQNLYDVTSMRKPTLLLLKS